MTEKERIDLLWVEGLGGGTWDDALCFNDPNDPFFECPIGKLPDGVAEFV